MCIYVYIRVYVCVCIRVIVSISSNASTITEVLIPKPDANTHRGGVITNLGVVTNFSISITSSPNDFIASRLAEASRSSNSSAVLHSLMPCVRCCVCVCLGVCVCVCGGTRS